MIEKSCTPGFRGRKSVSMLCTVCGANCYDDGTKDCDCDEHDYGRAYSGALYDQRPYDGDCPEASNLTCPYFGTNKWATEECPGCRDRHSCESTARRNSDWKD